jgi:hypothetical protein
MCCSHPQDEWTLWLAALPTNACTEKLTAARLAELKATAQEIKLPQAGLVNAYLVNIRKAKKLKGGSCRVYLGAISGTIREDLECKHLVKEIVTPRNWSMVKAWEDDDGNHHYLPLFWAAVWSMPG